MNMLIGITLSAIGIGVAMAIGLLLMAVLPNFAALTAAIVVGRISAMIEDDIKRRD